MKKFSLLLLVLSFVVFLGACGNTTVENSNGSSDKKASEEFPTKPITVIVSFGAGGGTDIGARILLPYVEKELGVPITVVNKDGGGGWVGWTDLLNQKKDGYTIGYINTPNLMTGYLNPELKRNNSLEDFDVIANHVLDYGAIAVRADDDRFETIEDLIEYAKGQELTTTSTGVASDDHVAALKVNKAHGTQFVAVHGSGAVYGKAGVLGGHIDVYFANVGEVTVPEKNGELRVLAVMAPERSDFLPHVPTLEEKGFGEIYSWSARGIAAAKGVDQAKLDIIIAAFEKALNDPEHIEKMENMGLEVKPMYRDEYRNFLTEDEAGVKEVLDLLGW
ncbi:tripartite tricarboxylate transporter substrate binding protein [Anaerobacillus isosaccharinicus]|uniref:Tripartite tricarboxylate transporter substrate binding protein n=1 Tax=Anaerobacillus isosaccharinicus TaxID=1532552 RepID=A0A1S2LIX5_9BACI|nr:tripartite tricarboxylate transporter substrate binding protein [Anaerobacillus isosaccharinicus]MBA5588309.1 tripartite tricarboxylate transporter substrate binding protein [Anaerobacillus isosaccharinicus]QOY38255.1 tripartite tricarboxylate transporter substrate binding protein [Anaerobacillus isosaccharinicus]